MRMTKTKLVVAGAISAYVAFGAYAHYTRRVPQKWSETDTPARGISISEVSPTLKRDFYEEMQNEAIAASNGHKNRIDACFVSVAETMSHKKRSFLDRFRKPDMGGFAKCMREWEITPELLRIRRRYLDELEVAIEEKSDAVYWKKFMSEYSPEAKDRLAIELRDLRSLKAMRAAILADSNDYFDDLQRASKARTFEKYDSYRDTLLIDYNKAMHELYAVLLIGLGILQAIKFKIDNFLILRRMEKIIVKVRYASGERELNMLAYEFGNLVGLFEYKRTGAMPVLANRPDRTNFYGELVDSVTKKPLEFNPINRLLALPLLVKIFFDSLSPVFRKIRQPFEKQTHKQNIEFERLVELASSVFNARTNDINGGKIQKAYTPTEDPG